MEPSRRRVRQPAWLFGRLERLREFVTGSIWSVDLASLSTIRALGFKTARVVFLAFQGFFRDRCSVRASALTYITVLSLVPLLAFSFSVAKGLGAYDTLRRETIDPFLDSTVGSVDPPAEPGPAEPAGVDEPPSTEPTAAALDPDLPEVTAAAEEIVEPEDVAEPEDTAATEELVGAVATSDPASEAAVAGSELRVAIDRVLEFVEKTNVSSLGSVGLIVLILAVIKLLSAIEQAFNDIWGLKKSRSILRKFSDYLSMVVVVPILVILASSAAATVQNATLLGTLKDELGADAVIDPILRLGSLFTMWIGFTFVYLFMPNTRTHVRSALIGGIVGGTLWHLAQVLHVQAQVGVANYNKLYAGFAAFPIFMVWIYVSWMTVLFGAEFAFAHQNEPSYRQFARTRHHDQSFREMLALRLAARVARAFVRGRPAPSPYDLAQLLSVPERAVQGVVATLVSARILVQADDGVDPSLLPARDLDTITVKNVFDALKGAQGPVPFQASDALDSELEEVYQAYEHESEASSFNRTLRELAEMGVEDPGGQPLAGPRPIYADDPGEDAASVEDEKTDAASAP